MPTYKEPKEENKTYSIPEITNAIVPTDGVNIEQPKEQKATDTHASGVIPDRDIFLLDKDSKVMRTDQPEQNITGTFNFGEWLKIDASNKRLIIHDGVTNRVVIGNLGSTIYGLKISNSTKDVLTATGTDIMFDTGSLWETSTEDGAFQTLDGQVIVFTNGVITDVQLQSVSLSPSISPSVSPSVSKSLSPSVSPSVSVSKSPSVSMSASPSISSSVSISKSPSVSISLSPSVSPSVSESLSPSTSPPP